MTPDSKHGEWKMVPVEPTEEMVLAAAMATTGYIMKPTFVAIYRAMLTAAPAAPSSGREEAANLVSVMIEQVPWKDHLWARAALGAAAHIVRRGRHLTEAEKMENLALAMEEDGTEEGAKTAATLRALRTTAPATGEGEGKGWQPIETAPMKEIVLVCNPTEGAIPVVAKRFATGWINIGLVPVGRSHKEYALAPAPTHWMPLPLAPDQQKPGADK